jgi:hypothetical protein
MRGSSYARILKGLFVTYHFFLALPPVFAGAILTIRCVRRRYVLKRLSMFKMLFHPA